MLKHWLLIFILAIAPALSHADDVDEELNDVEPLPGREAEYNADGSSHKAENAPA